MRGPIERMQRDWRPLALAMVAQGWRLRRMRDHVMACPPSGPAMCLPVNQCEPRALAIKIAEARRKGLVFG